MNFLIRAAVIAAVFHITPVVVLVKRPDAVRTLLPGADAYVASEVHLSAKDAHRLHEGVDWSPEDGVLVFYGGTAGTTSVGALEFVRGDTPHGPIQVGGGVPPPGAGGGGGWPQAGVGAGAAVAVPTRSPSPSSPVTPRRATSSRPPFRCSCATVSGSRTRPSRAASRCPSA